MNGKYRGVLTGVLLILLGAGLFYNCKISSAANTVTEKYGILRIVNLLALTEEEGEKERIEAAVTAGLLLDEEKADMGKKLTKERLAVLVNRMDESLYGQEYDHALYEQVKLKNRISDLSSIAKNRREDVIKVFCKGIMIGQSNGTCSQSRRFSGGSYLTKSEIGTILKRVTEKSQRKNLSPDGQLIRTTHLPKNYKSYEYILASFPNRFYEGKFEYQKTKYYKKPVELEDYASPAHVKQMVFAYNQTSMEEVMKRHLDEWCDKVEENMKLRFNVDYRTLDKEWINKLRSTYYIFNKDEVSNKIMTTQIKEYVSRMKKNKVVIKTQRVSVEPSTLYNMENNYVRVYVKFMLVAAKDRTATKDTVFCDDYIGNPMVIGKWAEQYFDIAIGSYNGNSLGEDYAVIDNKLIDTAF